jgi:hypothetical protein
MENYAKSCAECLNIYLKIYLYLEVLKNSDKIVKSN